MAHRRTAVELVPDAVSDELLDDPKPELVREPVDRRADLSHGNAGPADVDGGGEASIRRVHQSPHLVRDALADHDRPRRVAVVPVEVHRDVDVDDVAVHELGRVRDSVTDALVERRAHALRKAAVIQRARVRAGVDDHLVHLLIDEVRRDPGLAQRLRVVENLRGEQRRGAHLRDAVRVVDLVLLVHV
eukprot:27188-Pelagococcus_subviridis.AAC.1